jgi:hypothetical protein
MTSAGRFDLHTHSVRSDGHHTPREVVTLAHGVGLDGVALTDHDTGDGLAEALEAGDELGLEVIPGTEFSAELSGRSVHVLAYWHDHTEAALAAELLRLRDARSDRALRMVENFNALGVPITFTRVLEIAAGAPVGRPHLAQAPTSARCSSATSPTVVRPTHRSMRSIRSARSSCCEEPAGSSCSPTLRCSARATAARRSPRTRSRRWSSRIVRPA